MNGAKETTGEPQRLYESYLSPAPVRLEHPMRRWLAARDLAEPKIPHAPEDLAGRARLAQMEADIAALQQQQTELANNLREANAAFRSMASRVAELEKQRSEA